MSARQTRNAGRGGRGGRGAQQPREVAISSDSLGAMVDKSVKAAMSVVLAGLEAKGYRGLAGAPASNGPGTYVLCSLICYMVSSIASAWIEQHVRTISNRKDINPHVVGLSSKIHLLL
jgi:hypothetical protein